MKIGIAVFAYNRSRHLECVLESLRQNQGVEQVYIFQDGLKCEEHRMEWEKTRAVIENVDWCRKIVTTRTENIGLAKSIVQGINKVFEDNDAIIVLEDDCVAHPQFITFMVQCFEKYRDNDSVYSVSGYAWPSNALKKGEEDAYFCGRISSWGWGTWKDRWMEYEQDYTLLVKIKNDKEAHERLVYWGNDLEEMLVGNVRGTINSWAVFWALKVIEKNGMCVNPYESLIQNIGMDGTGVHSGVTTEFEVPFSDIREKAFCLPEKLEYDMQIKRNFVFGSKLAQSRIAGNGAQRALVYGIGKSFQENVERIAQEYQVVALVDRKKRGWIDGFEIVEPTQMQEFQYDQVVIMNKDLNLSLEIKQDLVDSYGVREDKIQLGCILYE